MNWKLVLQLSLFGLAMAFATVWRISSRIEPLVWLVIFVACAQVIATNAPGKYFLHGLMTSIVNSVWITAVHVLLADQYLAHHAEEAAMMAQSPMGSSPRMMMLITGPIVGVVSGLVLGLFAVVARKLTGPKAQPAP